MYKSTFLKKFKILGEKMINIKFNDYKDKIKSYLDMRMFSMPFLIVNVARLDINVRYIYLWQDAKGHVCYCFDILDGDYFTTSAPKLGNVLSQHFKCEIEVVNNEKEHLKKMVSAQAQLNKGIGDLERHNLYNGGMNLQMIHYLIYPMDIQIVFLLFSKIIINILYKIKKTYIMVL